MQIERCFLSELRNMHAYLGQERAGEGFAAGEVRVAQPDMLVARKTPARQPVAAREKNCYQLTIRGIISYICSVVSSSNRYPWPGRKA